MMIIFLSAVASFSHVEAGFNQLYYNRARNMKYYSNRGCYREETVQCRYGETDYCCDSSWWCATNPRGLYCSAMGTNLWDYCCPEYYEALSLIANGTAEEKVVQYEKMITLHNAEEMLARDPGNVKPEPFDSITVMAAALGLILAVVALVGFAMSRKRRTIDTPSFILG